MHGSVHITEGSADLSSYYFKWRERRVQKTLASKGGSAQPRVASVLATVSIVIVALRVCLLDPGDCARRTSDE